MDDQEVMRLTAENTALLNEITRLRTELFTQTMLRMGYEEDNKRLRAALEQFADIANWVPQQGWFVWCVIDDPRHLAANALRPE